jgi:hypothetical protein
MFGLGGLFCNTVLAEQQPHNHYILSGLSV